MFWKRKCKHNFLPADVEEPRPLTGIEKMAIEEPARLYEETRIAEEKRVNAIREQIAEIERRIGPEMALLNQLKATLQPSSYVVIGRALYDYQHQSQQQGALGYCGPSGLLGDMAGSMFR